MNMNMNKDGTFKAYGKISFKLFGVKIPINWLIGETWIDIEKFTHTAPKRVFLKAKKK